MAKTKRLNIDSVDYIAPKNDAKEVISKKNIKQFSKNNFKILLVFSGFFLMFILGLVLTPIGLALRPAPSDLGLTSISSTIACLGIIFFLFSLLGVILVIPIIFRFFKKRKEIKKSSKTISNN